MYTTVDLSTKYTSNFTSYKLYQNDQKNNLKLIFPLISVLFMNSISHISLPVSTVGIYLCSSKLSVSNGQAQSIHYGAFIPRMMEMTGHKNTVENIGSKNVHNTTDV